MKKRVAETRGWLRRLSATFIMGTVLILLSASPLTAQEEEDIWEEEAAVEKSQPASPPTTLEDLHHLGLFLGATREDNENEGTVGLNYQYRFARFFSAGGILEHAGGDIDTTTLLGGLFFGPFRNLVFIAGAGFEDDEHGDDDFLVRVGIAYEMEFGRFSIAPEFNVDFVDKEEVEVFGLKFGFDF